MSGECFLSNSILLEIWFTEDEYHDVSFDLWMAMFHAWYMDLNGSTLILTIINTIQI